MPIEQELYKIAYEREYYEYANKVRDYLGISLLPSIKLYKDEVGFYDYGIGKEVILSKKELDKTKTAYH